jgi:hypothetical protein
MSRNVALLVVVVLLTGCSAGVCPAPLPAFPEADLEAVPEALPRPVPRILTRVDAETALRTRASPHGFQVDVTCQGRSREGCRPQGTEGARWVVGTLATGKRLPGGHGLRERVTTTVMAWPSPAQARRYVSGLARRFDRYRGKYAVPVKRTRSVRYVPGDRGKGEVQHVGLAGWRGLGLRRSFVLRFHDDETSRTAYGGRFVMRRGAYVVDVDWVGRNQSTDRRLSHLPRRLIRGLR